MASDARDILGDSVFKNSKEKKDLYKKNSNKKRKRPEGMSLELYGLLNTSTQDPNSLVPTNYSNGGYKERARLSGKKTREWRKTEFENAGRSDGLKLTHWAVKDSEVDGKKYPFSDFNQNMPFPTYSDSEYNSLKSESWSRCETDYMMDLCKAFDCRFVLVADRYDYQELGKPKDRSVEDIKERFYQISAINNRNNDKATYVFDAPHERRRKQQLDMFLRRSRKDVEELQKLQEDQKRSEQKRREKERKEAERNKLIDRVTGLDSPPSASQSGHKERKKVRDRKTSGATGNRQGREGTPPFDSDESVPSPSTLAIIQNNKAPDFGLRFPELKAGIHLQSGRMILPASTTKKRDQIISHAVKEFGIDPLPIPTSSVSDEFNRLRSDILKLHDTQYAIQHCDVEILALISRYEQLYPGEALPPGIENVEYLGKRKLSPSGNVPEKKKRDFK